MICSLAVDAPFGPDRHDNNSLIDGACAVSCAVPSRRECSHRRAPLLGRPFEAAYPHGDDAEYCRGDSQDLCHPVLASQAEIVA
jgi:hypothetical protein